MGHNPPFSGISGAALRAALDPLNGNVEPVGKARNFEFSRKKVLCFQGSIFQKRLFLQAR